MSKTIRPTPDDTEVPRQLPEELRPLPEEREDRSTRRMLLALLLLLALGAAALLGLLLWLLRPNAQGGQERVAGYPIEVVATIYGSGTAEEEQLRAPMGVELDGSGNVWISDTGRSRVEEYTSDGTYVRTLGEDPTAGGLVSPYGLAVDDARGRIYVADFYTRTVQIFTLDGGYVGHLPADDQRLGVFGADGFSPYDVALLNGRIVVSSNDGLYVFDQNGHVVERWGETVKGKNVRGSDWGSFNFPDSIVADASNDRIYVADTLNRRVVALDGEGNWLWASGRADVNGKLKGFWQLPRSVAVGPDGRLYVTDTFRPDAKGMGTGHIVVLSADGELLSEFGRTGSGDGDFRFPEQLASGPDGLWAIADRENDRVVVFRLHPPYPAVDDLLASKYGPGFSTGPKA
jgi:DNA-binding beta-propeller fold protein YncE